jgi:hypothetical protein
MGSLGLLQRAIEVTLKEEVKRLWPVVPERGSARMAYGRLEALAHHAPPIMALLAEPWGDQKAAMSIVCDASVVHLYARILDDAIDENLVVHRRQLLLAQPMYWKAVGRLAMFAGSAWETTAELIEDTVLAAEHDADCPEACHWGPKNHHLLVAPMLLSLKGGPSFAVAKPLLSCFIAVMQAGDEWRQGMTSDGALKTELIDFIAQTLEQDVPAALAKLGWVGAGERFVAEAASLLRVLGGARQEWTG